MDLQQVSSKATLRWSPKGRGSAPPGMAARRSWEEAGLLAKTLTIISIETGVFTDTSPSADNSAPEPAGCETPIRFMTEGGEAATRSLSTWLARPLAFSELTKEQPKTPFALSLMGAKPAPGCQRRAQRRGSCLQAQLPSGFLRRLTVSVGRDPARSSPPSVALHQLPHRIMEYPQHRLQRTRVP
jgi:hypothetical protein